MTAHIGDFGLAKIVSTISGEAMQFPSTSFAIKGSIGYVAPEYGMGEPVSIEGDVYSYGILLLEMFTGKKPTDDYFKDELNLHTLVERSLPHKAMEIVDSSILSEDARGSFKEYCVISVLRIGVACSMELPAERIKMRDVISELEKIKGIYEQGEMEQNQGML
uniref:LRR-RLK n=1 Tax=Vernicia montana TaxID=316732 RepID=A0A140G4W0_9ROSI|nr:LRR-RLK [Vernicia montana]